MITLIVELSCDASDCELAYAPAVNELTDVRATRKGAENTGWSSSDGKDYCPTHGASETTATVALVRGLAAGHRNDTEIGEGLGWPRWRVQKFRARHGIPSGACPGRPLGARARREQAVSS